MTLTKQIEQLRKIFGDQVRILIKINNGKPIVAAAGLDDDEADSVPADWKPIEKRPRYFQ